MKTRKWMGIAVVVLLSLWMTAQVVSGEKSTTSFNDSNMKDLTAESFLRLLHL